MYSNQNPYGQPHNIGFNPNPGFGQQQQNQYPGQQGGLPYPVYPGSNPGQQGVSGFQSMSSTPPYPQAPGILPPQLPVSGSGFSGYPSSQPSGYPAFHTSGGYAPSQTPSGYPSTQASTGYPPSQPAGYPQSALGYQPQSQPSVGYPPSSGYNPNPQVAYGQQPGIGYSSAPNQQISGGYPSAAAPPLIQPSVYPQASHAPPSQSYPNLGQQGHGYGPVTATSAYPTQQFSSQSSPSHYPKHGATPGGQHYSTMQSYVEQPTVIPLPSFDPAADAQALRKAMKGFGTDEATILNIICKRTNVQRLQIAQAFKTSFGKDLIKDLRSELGGRLEDVILALMTPRFDYLAITLQKAISGLGTKERLLVDVLCTATNDEIRMIIAAYGRLFGRSLDNELQGDTSGHFRRLLVSVANCGRMEGQPPDPHMAASDAQALYSAGANKIGTDESTFNQILCLRSFPHLRLVFHEYEKQFGQPFEKVIENEFSGDIEAGLKAVVACAKNRAAYFASRLHESFAGFGTKDEELIFIMVTRCDVDLRNIKDEYQRRYNKSLASAVASETSGDYKKALITLLGE